MFVPVNVLEVEFGRQVFKLSAARPR
eukprot:SAG25_NODE_13748_length_263_cov_0.932927_1_plen_25_part_01